MPADGRAEGGDHLGDEAAIEVPPRAQLAAASAGTGEDATAGDMRLHKGECQSQGQGALTQTAAAVAEVDRPEPAPAAERCYGWQSEPDRDGKIAARRAELLTSAELETDPALQAEWVALLQLRAALVAAKSAALPGAGEAVADRRRSHIAEATAARDAADAWAARRAAAAQKVASAKLARERAEAEAAVASAAAKQRRAGRTSAV